MSAELKPSVRINAESKKRLEEIQLRTKRSQTSLLDRAVELLAREVLSQQMVEDLADLSADPDALAKYNALTLKFDQTISDGVQHE